MPKCIFCGSTKKISKEHLFGKWWEQFYPADDAAKRARFTHKVTTDFIDGEAVVGRGQFSNVGDILAKTTKVVCSKCNSGWMSKIEENMKRAFVAIYCDGATTISEQQGDAIRKWMFLKLCLHERAYAGCSPEDNAFATSEEILAEADRQKSEMWRGFYQSGSPPADFRFYLARCRPQGVAFQHLPGALSLDNAFELRWCPTCVFVVGDFGGVVTNLFGVLGSTRGVVELSPGDVLAPTDVIEAYDFEDAVLSLVEKYFEDSPPAGVGKGGHRYRRHFPLPLGGIWQT